MTFNSRKRSRQTKKREHNTLPIAWWLDVLAERYSQSGYLVIDPIHTLPPSQSTATSIASSRCTLNWRISA